MAKLLISYGARVDDEDECGAPPLFDAADGNAPEVAELLIAHGANVRATDADGRTALHAAAGEATRMRWPCC